MRKILFYFHDVGGLNFCLPAVSELLHAPDLALDIYCSGPSVNYIIARGIKSKAVDIKKLEDVERILNECNPNLIVTGTSRYSKSEIGFWKAARKRHIASMCVIDYWMDHTCRFSENGGHFFPDTILVPDISVADDIRKKFYLSDSRVIVTGHPYLESLENYRPLHTRPAFYKAIGLRCDVPTVAYFSDTISQESDRKNNGLNRALFYDTDEKKALSLLIDALNNINHSAGMQCQLLVKHHPSERTGNLDSIIKTLKEKKMIAVADGYNSKEIIYHSEAIFSIFGMPLLEAYVMKKPVFSICNSKIECNIWTRFPFDIRKVKNKAQIKKAVSSISSSHVIINTNLHDAISIRGSKTKVIHTVMKILDLSYQLKPDSV